MIFVFHQTASKTCIKFTMEMFAFHNGCLPIEMGLINSYIDCFTHQYYNRIGLETHMHNLWAIKIRGTINYDKTMMLVLGFNTRLAQENFSMLVPHY